MRYVDAGKAVIGENLVIGARVAVRVEYEEYMKLGGLLRETLVEGQEVLHHQARVNQGECTPQRSSQSTMALAPASNAWLMECST